VGSGQHRWSESPGVSACRKRCSGAVPVGVGSRSVVARGNRGGVELEPVLPGGRSVDLNCLGLQLTATFLASMTVSLPFGYCDIVIISPFNRGESGVNVVFFISHNRPQQTAS